VTRTALVRRANIAVIVLCCVILWQGLSDRLKAPAQPSSSVAAGYRIPLAVFGEEHPRAALLLYTSSTCPFCVESLRFYRRLSSDARTHGVRFVGVSSEETEHNRTFLAAGGVSIDGMVSLGQSGLPLRGTPALVLVGRDGRVTHSWEGMLGADGEQEVLHLISKTIQ
jgi:peroxiredoxin